MAQPPSYNREKNFADDFGNETDHSSLNAELDRASNSINDIRSNLAILQADDGKLRPAVVTADSISEELRVSLVEGVVMDAQSMLDRSLAAADASSASAAAAKASEKVALECKVSAVQSATSAQQSAAEAAESAGKAKQVNADWNATEGPAEILNKPELSVVATSGKYDDLDGLPQNLATDSDIALLHEEIARKGVPVGTVEYFATSTPPAGYLKADGAAVVRETYPDLYAAIGTTFGAGDGKTTFNLPDLIDRFAQGSSTPGLKIEAGLPNITGSFGDRQTGTSKNGCFYTTYGDKTGGMGDGIGIDRYIGFDAKLSNPTYGASDTVQPPALTLLPCIKAFDAATNPGLIDVTELANEIAGKLDRVIDSKPVRYVIDAYNDGTNWYRKWSDGWLEQGGTHGAGTSVTVTLHTPFINNLYSVQLTGVGSTSAYAPGLSSKTTTNFLVYSGAAGNAPGQWYACGY